MKTGLFHLDCSMSVKASMRNTNNIVIFLNKSMTQTPACNVGRSLRDNSD